MKAMLLLPVHMSERWCEQCAQPQGGGNCANALTGAARLGLRPTLITKIGDDNLGDALIKVWPSASPASVLPSLATPPLTRNPAADLQFC